MSKRFAEERGVPCWNLGVNIVVLTSGLDKIGWHSDQQGEKYVGCIILDTPNDPRPVVGGSDREEQYLTSCSVCEVVSHCPLQCTCKHCWRLGVISKIIVEICYHH